jgi:ATP-binding cassette, subfamily F, member 3
VALAKTIVSKANFLMLDEPTNHLDMHSVELLIEALNKYEGSIVLVSHDRYFISRIANKIWEIEDHKIVEFKGSYAEWEEWKARREAERSKQQKAIEVVKPQPEKQAPVKEQAPAAVQNSSIDKELKKEYQKYKTRFGQLEDKIAQLSKQKTELEAAMASPDSYADKNKFQQTESSYNTVTAELNLLNKEYETVFEKVMELEDKMG